MMKLLLSVLFFVAVNANTSFAQTLDAKDVGPEIATIKQVAIKTLEEAKIRLMNHQDSSAYALAEQMIIMFQTYRIRFIQSEGLNRLAYKVNTTEQTITIYADVYNYPAKWRTEAGRNEIVAELMGRALYPKK